MSVFFKFIFIAVCCIFYCFILHSKISLPTHGALHGRDAPTFRRPVRSPAREDGGREGSPSRPREWTLGRRDDSSTPATAGSALCSRHLLARTVPERWRYVLACSVNCMLKVCCLTLAIIIFLLIIQFKFQTQHKNTHPIS